MKTLRRLHLYLGCVFAPMLVFFALSGIWQTCQAHLPKGDRASTVMLLSTLHTGRSLKTGGDSVSTLSSPWMQAFAVAMALALVGTIVLGVIMAFRFGRRSSALWCLALGVVVPLAIVLLTLQSHSC